MQEEDRRNTGSPVTWSAQDQPEAREGQAGRGGVAERPVVPLKSGNADGGEAGLHPEQWLLIEWPAGDTDLLKYYLSTLPDDIALNDLVARAHMRWRIERDYQDLKQDLGLGHYEWRGWRGLPRQ